MRPVPVGVVRTRDLSHLRSASLFWEGSGPHPSPAASAVGFIAGSCPAWASYLRG